MAFSQWTISKEANIGFDLTTATVLEGASSLRMRATTGSSGHEGVIGLTSGATSTTGKIRSLFRMVTNTTDNYSFGVFGMMQSSINFASNAYWASISPDTDVTLVRLVKGAATGISGAGLATAAHGLTMTTSLVFGLELKWQRDPDSGFVVLTVAMGTATDFSDLSTKITHTDSSSPYSTSVSAGLVMIIGGTAVSADSDVHADRTQIFRT